MAEKKKTKFIKMKVTWLLFYLFGLGMLQQI